MSDLLSWLKIPRNTGYIIVDLGSWKGYTATNFSNAVGKKGLVIAVEPVYKNFKKIIKRLLVKRVGGVIPILAAIGNKTERGMIYLDDISQGHSLYFKKKFKGKKIKRLPCLVVSWDDLVDMLQLEKVDFCKVNIEGAEESLLEGMTKVFPKKMVIQEHTSENITDLDNLERLLKEKGYKIDQIMKGKKVTYYYVKR